jgi:hypothetical protein
MSPGWRPLGFRDLGDGGEGLVGIAEVGLEMVHFRSSHTLSGRWHGDIWVPSGEEAGESGGLRRWH